MIAIFKRELNSYFSSAIGYTFLAVFYILSAIFFSLANLLYNSSSTSSLFSQIVFIMIFLIPILTMRLMCEEKKQKTDQLLLTSPVSLTGMVFGKFLAALAVFGLGLASTIIYSLTMAIYVELDTAVILGSIVGVLLLAAALIAIGIFISSLTENQVVAAVASLFVMLLLYLINGISSLVSNSILNSILSALSISSRYNNFAMGIFNLSDAIYYFSIAAVFMFLTVRMLEKRRWS